MSKRNSRIAGSLLRSFASVLIVCGCMSLLADSSLAQDDGKGFSIFEPAATSAEAPAVAPKDAFTSPVARLPKSQFGSFENGNSTTVSSKPQLKGSKPEGTYAHDGRKMFSQPPAIQVNPALGDSPAKPIASSRLQPFARNSLRAEDRPQPDNDIEVESKPAPIVVGEFQKLGRSLLPAANSPAQIQPTKPKVAQVTFQDAGFTSTTRPQEQRSTANRFGQSTANRFGQSSQSTPSTANRFGNSASKPTGLATSPPSQPARKQLGQGRTPFAKSGARPVQTRPPVQSLAPATQRAAAPAVRRDFPGLRSQQSPRTLTPRVASNPMQPISRRTNPVAPVTPTSGKAGAQAAKELLGVWAQANPELKLPGKRMKLHEFLAQPINGSRKDAINQYWVTFGDMANHKLAIEQSQWLSSIANPRQQTDQAILKVAQQDAQNRVLQTNIQLAKSQSILADFLPNLRYKNGKSIPVLPSDVPWVGKLNTKLAEYQKRGIVPVRFNAIDDILPKARQLIANRADALNAASRAAQQAKTALNSGQSPVANVLEAARIKVKNQQDFLANVTGYNRAITDYVLSVRQDINQPKRLASVLIGRKSVQGSVAKSAAPEEDNDSSSNKPNPMQQVSALQPSAKAKSATDLQGRSAYQNQNASSGLRLKSGNSLAPMNTPQPAAKPKSSFAYGPTKESAAAANFDPDKVKAELPMQEAKPKGTSPIYNQQNTASGGGIRSGRTALNPVGVGQRSQLNRGQGTRQPVASPPRVFAPKKPVGQTGGQSTGGFRPVTGGSFGGMSSPTSGTSFSPKPSGAEAAPSISKTPGSSPFSQVDSTKPDATAASANTTNRFDRSSGIGGTPKADSTAARFGGGGSGFGSSAGR